ncbi:uncharacterized protein si:dkey-7l6.3 isoform X4 [Danio rerio]|uniref:Uncharacterized protein si:dkey-7l6.3 isoform X4 n=1 Tax=Danio rerio TaxID=7955 RepID=A0AC58HT70_DANRE
MANYRAFHTQLATIMETLTRAAVAEICELVDDGYAVLHIEISRHQKENEELRRKLQLIESIVAARGYSEESSVTRDNSAREPLLDRKTPGGGESSSRATALEVREFREEGDLIQMQIKEEGFEHPPLEDEDEDEDEGESVSAATHDSPKADVTAASDARAAHLHRVFQEDLCMKTDLDPVSDWATHSITDFQISSCPHESHINGKLIYNISASKY